MRLEAAFAACTFGCMLASAVASAQAPPRDFPVKSVRIVVPVPPGGIVDVVTRVLGQRLTEVMGQTVIIDNRPGASTIVGSELVARAPADGYTLLSTSLPLVVNPNLHPRLPFDAEK
ncbi:MAG TPA: tripartite tricarboxylate transporter substrate-binding protein, partial [Burkholderiales bacterium]|nr:tripartite tricarboxylate transporter substrate-binding protein [Burkholderiales bacterium]